MALRAGSPALRRGIFENLTPSPRRGWAYSRREEHQRALVALNFHDRPLQLRLDGPTGAAHWELALSSTPRDPAHVDGNVVHLAPHEAAVFLHET
jgi:hypothetical protein